MASDSPVPAEGPAPDPGTPSLASGRWSWSARIAAGVLGLLGLLVLTVAVLDSPIGHRFVIDRIAGLAPASGLRIEIGRIDGSLFDSAVLHDVELKDPRGTFLTVPEVELDWRPLAWLNTGLDVRRLTTRRGHLLRLPKFNPGKPGGSTLPNYDIRVDKLQIVNLTVDKGVLGERRRINLLARADVRNGRALVDIDGRFGGRDRLRVKLDSQPDRDKFALFLNYTAPRGGLLAGLTGANGAVDATIRGAGGWKSWNGIAVARRNGSPALALLLANRAGRYTAAGEAYPHAVLTGAAKRAAGERLAVRFDGTFANNVIDGRLALTGAAFALGSRGRIDLGRDRADKLFVRLALLRPDLLLTDPKLQGVGVTATINGPFRNLAIDHRLRIGSLRSGVIQADALQTAGRARWNGRTLSVPLALVAGRLATGNRDLDSRLAGGRVTGTLALTGTRLSSQNLTADFRQLAARLVLEGDWKRGGFALAGPISARAFPVPNVGVVNGDAKILLKFGAGMPWTLQANLAGRMTRVDNATLRDLAGGPIRFGGGVRLGQQVPLLFDKVRLDAPKLAMVVTGQRLADGRTILNGTGRHAEYGPFTVEAGVGSAGLNAVLVLADPWPTMGLKDVRIALSPISDGFRIETAGQSRLGPFDGVLGLYSTPGGPTRVAIDRLKVWETAVTGSVLLANGGVTGDIALAGGGLDGTVRIVPAGAGQQVDAQVAIRNAHFGGTTPLSIGNGRVEASGLLEKGRSTINATVYAEGVSSGALFIGKLAANARLVNGAGRVTATVAGRRGSRFAVQGVADIAPDRVTVLAGGEYAGRRIIMPRQAVLTREEAGGWQLAPTQLTFGRGVVIASGRVLGGPADLRLEMAEMPLSLADIAVADLGLGGTASGIVDIRSVDGAPQAQARLAVKGLTRSGLVLTSRPVDLYMVAALDAHALETRAVVEEKGEVRGRLQARIVGLPMGGALAERLRAGQLQGQLRYNGPADALWRLTGVEVFDLTGPVGVAADVAGTLDNPQVRGSVVSREMRLQSALTGTDLRQVAMRGSFAGSRLTLNGFTGVTANGGRISGSGTVDLSDIVARGVPLDLKLSASNAQVLNRDDMAATVTGPLRIVSDGRGGTIAGRVRVDAARWQLGRAGSVAELPDIRTREVNQRADVAPPRVAARPWRWLIDAAGDSRIMVRGLGLDSEWSARVRLRGDTLSPQLFGTAGLVRGGYEFAGKRFELTRGRIAFDGNVPIDPRLDIVAEGDVQAINSRIIISGSSQRPSITFSSIPALPEEELLSRLLFGSSIAQISAPEAVQLAAAVASLRGGSGLDPINRLRSAIGLDRLRVVGADAAKGTSTSIAVGKYLGRRVFVELVTDGKGYSASSVEFRITRWLALLGTVSTIGNESVNVKVSKDY